MTIKLNGRNEKITQCLGTDKPYPCTHHKSQSDLLSYAHFTSQDTHDDMNSI